jgi:hypothetical protein
MSFYDRISFNNGPNPYAGREYAPADPDDYESYPASSVYEAVNPRIRIHSANGTCVDEQCLYSSPKNAILYRTIASVNQFFLKHFDHDGMNGKHYIPDVYRNWEKFNAALSCAGDYVESCALLFNEDNRFYNPAVIAHEFTHGVVKSFVNLSFVGESGALSESLGDVFAIMFKHQQNLGRDWTIIDRDLKESIDVSQMQRLKFGERPNQNLNDNGYVHHNSAIPSHAFYLAVKGAGDKTCGKVADVWFKTLSQLSTYETFKSFACKTVAVAKHSHPEVALSIAHAWNTVLLLRPASAR